MTAERMSKPGRDALVAHYRACPTKNLLVFRARWQGQCERGQRNAPLSYDTAIAAGRVVLLDHILDRRGVPRDANGEWYWTEQDERRERNAGR